MDTYVIQIRLRTGVDPTKANNALQGVVDDLVAGGAVEVPVFYAVQATDYDYLAIIDAVTLGAARGAAVALGIGGDAKTSLAPAMTAGAYGETLVDPFGIR